MWQHDLDIYGMHRKEIVLYEALHVFLFPFLCIHIFKTIANNFDLNRILKMTVIFLIASPVVAIVVHNGSLFRFLPISS